MGAAAGRMLHKLNINNGSNISAAGAMGQDPDPAGAKTEKQNQAEPRALSPSSNK